MFDSALWLNPLNGDNPSGESLRNDGRFHELERLVQPQIEISRDERNNPVARTEVPVDWSIVLRKSEELRTHGRDLRLLVIVTRALANERGLAGLAEGLNLIGQTFDMHWQTMHPELRDGLPPREAALRRINALIQLQNDKDGLLGDLRKMTFFTPRGAGPVTGRDLERGAVDSRTVLNEAAPGLSTAEKASLVSEHDQLLNRVRFGCAAFAEQTPDEAAALAADARAAAAALEAAEQSLNRQIGGDLRVTLPDLSRFLQRMSATLERAKRHAQQESQKEDTAGGEPAPAAAASVAADQAPSGPATVFPSRLSSRDEVTRCIDLIIAFYDRTEPSSPIPHLARRIKRMVPMDFLELMEDLAPSGLKEFRLLAGVSESKKPAPGTKGDQQ
ncbi:type VI secretion system protein TssA [Rhizobium lentis]|uniref:Type VI secretion system protein TssA n=1 Tax=Rhizobium lentis TaxID=1138194 RepID=A0ABS7IMB1_9HYPH|nr:type VI secretion system protein TssA [Rhizobium lentis]MBX4956775.1 type VI secretion system protein TssA [Rhizobium lentis]MBX4986472.1 type VI secretion system protein TssA [Rhizobium lentis]MBX5004916.1 type VI secretion system protein TssA [Rhizobium lentis]MBX5011153.1 type VI secretion system protein TssA [Rhizobium lentis]MBX5030613.1 type VI secretion system protein TssA [Rhizobium lentis]